MLSRTPLLSVVLVLSSFNGSPIASATNVVRQVPPPSPSISFKAPPTQVITCNSTTFAWDYSGPDLRMSLYVTNRDVGQPKLPSLSSVSAPSSTTTAPLGAPTVFFSLSEDLAPIYDTNYTWESVALPHGWYVLEGELRAANYTARGAPFLVEESGDNACLQVMAPHPTSGTSRQLDSYSKKVEMLVGMFGLLSFSALIGI